MYYYIESEAYNVYPGLIVLPILYALYFIIYIPIWTVHLVNLVKKHKQLKGKRDIWEAWRVGTQNASTSQ